MDSYSGWDDSKDSTVITLGTGLSLEFSRLTQLSYTLNL